VNRRRRLAGPGVAAALLVAMAVSGCAGPEAPSVRPSPVATGTAIASSSITSAAGFTVYPAGQGPVLPALTGPDLAGSALTVPSSAVAVSVVNVWASWCQPCVAEMPKLKAVAARFAADDVAVSGVATRDRTGAAVSFLAATRFDLPSLADPNGATVARWSAVVPASAVPSTLVVDASGRVRARWIGPVDETRLADEVCATLRSEKQTTASCPD
jgi:peroxiredoxin